MSQDNSSTDPLSAAWSFGKLMPGFGFLEQWTKGASAAMPSMGQWVAPTLDPAELEKRIQDLRTVQFWLEQNARMIGMTIQALEVQRMTLDTLKGMNVPVDALRESLKVRTPPPASEPLRPSAAQPRPAAAPATEPKAEPAADASGAAAEGAASIDPMRWWGTLTKQFTDLAANTMQDALKTDGALASAKQAAKPSTAAASKAGASNRASRSKAAVAPTRAATSASAKVIQKKPAPAAKRTSAKTGSASAED